VERPDGGGAGRGGRHRTGGERAGARAHRDLPHLGDRTDRVRRHRGPFVAARGVAGRLGARPRRRRAGALAARAPAQVRSPRGLNRGRSICAQVAELVDALVSGISGRKVVGVRVPSWAPRRKRPPLVQRAALSLAPMARLTVKRGRQAQKKPRTAPRDLLISREMLGAERP
jgi:hypothetical protein